MLARLARDEEERDQCGVGDGFVQIPDDFGQRRDELGLADDLRHVSCTDRLGRGDRDVDLGEALAFEAGGERDQPGVVPHGQCRDRRRVDAAGQERADRDIGTHVLGDGVLEHSGDLVVARLFAAGAEPAGKGTAANRGVKYRVTSGRLSRPYAGVAARLEPAHTAVQRLRFRHVLQNRVVLHGALVDSDVEADGRGEVQQAFLLAAEHGARRSGRHVQRLDAERIAGAEQFTLDGVPQGEREHAAQPGQRVRTPVVVGGDDRLAVAVGGEHGAVFGCQLCAQLEVVVDLAVEHQHVAVGGLRRTPAQRLVAVRDVDDRQPVETEHASSRRRPRAWLVRTAVTHQVRGAGNRVDEARGDVGGRVGQQGQQSAHRASMPNRGGVSRPASSGGLRCVVFGLFYRLLGGANVTPRGVKVVALAVVLGGWRCCSAGVAGRRRSASAGRWASPPRRISTASCGSAP